MADATAAPPLGMFGSGYIEMLARQMTADLQVLPPGTTSRIVDEHGNPRTWPNG